MEKARRILLLLAMALGHAAFGQSPIVYSADRSNTAMRDVVTLHGSDFGTDPNLMHVYFGASRAEIKFISNQMIAVWTPGGTTFDPITVTNIGTGRTAYAPGHFFLNYQGETGIASTEFSSQTDFQAQSGLYDLCLCDFNDDGKVDVATASNNSNLITLFQNTSTPGNITLTAQDFLVNARTLHIKCGDLNGDGRPDVVLSEGADGDRIFVLTNNGNFNFSLQSVRLTSKVKQVAIRDLDLDGRPEIMVTNTGGNIVSILPNQSTRSSISFSTPLSLSFSQATSTDAIAIADINDDGLPEIVTSQYQADNENKLFIAVNRGAFNFSEIKVIAVNKAVSSIRIADFNDDAKPDIAIARLTGSDISVYLNNSDTDIAFKQPLFFITDVLPVGMDFSDFDGDGKLDIAVGSISKSVSILNNISTASSPGTFAPVVKLSSTYINRNIRNADMDGDGKPDIVFTSVDDFSGVPTPASKISVIRNLSCMIPKVSPGGPLNVCIGTPLKLTATSGGGTYYQWSQAGNPTPVKSGTENFLHVNASGEYSVTAISGPCSKVSNTVQVSMTQATVDLSQVATDPRSNSPVCTDNELTLEVNDVGATEYRWRGPDGFSATTTTPRVSNAGFSQRDAGFYFVDIVSGSCVARTDSTLVEAISVPDFNILFSGGDTFCTGTTKTVSITPRLTSGFTYRWYEKTAGLLEGMTSDTYDASASGEYYATVTPANSGCSEKATPSVILTALSQPVAGFEGPEKGCTGSPIAFAQQSSGTPGVQLIYLWSFGDGDNSEEADAIHTYDQPGPMEVTLKVAYADVQTCSATISKPLTIATTTIPQITTSATSMCAGDDVTLSIYGTFASITWNTGEKTSAIYIQSAGNYSVSTTDANGCASADEIAIAENPSPSLTVSADKETIAGGQSAQLNASGADTYSWSPGKTLSDSTISNPLATPGESTTYVVTGALTGGCTATATIALQVTGEVINIVVPVLFSPNGDDVNEMLVIDGVENYPDCALNVFDKRGGRVFGTLGYQNNWDGTIQGTPLPEGVYYYVFGCPNKKTVTGTVTVIR